jgi:hypothetical protein
MDFIMKGQEFDVVNFIFREMDDCKRDIVKNLYFAPYLMKLILDKAQMSTDDLKLVAHPSYQPRGDKQTSTHSSPLRKRKTTSTVSPQEPGEASVPAETATATTATSSASTEAESSSSDSEESGSSGTYKLIKIFINKTFPDAMKHIANQSATLSNKLDKLSSIGKMNSVRISQIEATLRGTSPADPAHAPGQGGESYLNSNLSFLSS